MLKLKEETEYGFSFYVKYKKYSVLEFDLYGSTCTYFRDGCKSYEEVEEPVYYAWILYSR